MAEGHRSQLWAECRTLPACQSRQTPHPCFTAKGTGECLVLGHPTGQPQSSCREPLCPRSQCPQSAGLWDRCGSPVPHPRFRSSRRPYTIFLSQVSPSWHTAPICPPCFLRDPRWSGGCCSSPLACVCCWWRPGHRLPGASWLVLLHPLLASALHPAGLHGAHPACGLCLPESWLPRERALTPGRSAWPLQPGLSSGRLPPTVSSPAWPSVVPGAHPSPTAGGGRTRGTGGRGLGVSM